MFWTTYASNLRSQLHFTFLLVLFSFLSLNAQVWHTHVDLADLNCTLEIEITNTVHTCDGAEVCISITGGTPPYTFTLNGNDANNNPGTNLNVCFQELEPGAYTLTATDAEDCTQSIDFDIPFVDFYLGAQVTNAGCHGSNDGAIQLEILIDLAPLFYHWEGPNGYIVDLQDVEKIEHLEPGEYSVSVTSLGNYCIGIGSWLVEEPEPIDIEVAITTPACGAPDVCVLVNGGVAPYQVWAFLQLPDILANSPSGQLDDLTDLNPGNAIPLLQTSTTAAYCANDVPNGTYYILVLDANFCYSWEEVTIDAQGSLERTTTVEGLSCNGASDGSVCFEILSGTPPFSTIISPSTNNVAIVGSEGCFDHLASGNYVLTSTDANGCSISETIFVYESDELTATFSITSAPCSAEVDGCLVVEGGSMPYEVYVWEWPEPNSNVLPDVEFTAAGPLIENANPVDYITFHGTPVVPYMRCAEDIPPGYYLILVVDAHGCYTLLPVNIPETNGLETSFEITSSDCEDGVSGCLTIEGGMPPYDIWVWIWNSPLTVIPNVQFDADGVPFIEDAELTDVVYFGPNNNTDVNTRCADNIPPGNYLVLTLDADGCYDLLPVHIPSVSNLAAEFEITSPACSDQVNGCLAVSGGAAPYHLWVWHWPDPTTDVLPTVSFDDNGNPQVDQAIPTDAFDFFADPNTSNYVRCAENIPAGYYLVLVVDANGCYVLLPVIIPEPNRLGLHIVSRDVTCHGDEDGIIKLTIIGGTPPYTIAFDGSTISILDNGVATFENLAPGIYTITVADANQCTGTYTVEIGEPEPLDILLDFDPYGSYACAEPIGGVPPYQFRWFNLGMNAVIGQDGCIENLGVGVYMVVVADENDCQTAELLFIDEQPCQGGEASVDPEVIQSGETTTFTLSNYSGLSIQWQFKTEATPWLNIPGATTEVYETFPINTGSDKIIQVRAEVICQNGDALYSTVTEFKVEGSNLLVPYTSLVEDQRLFDPAFRQRELAQLGQELSLGIRVYPTQSSDVVYVEFQENQLEPGMVLMINSVGQTVYSQAFDQVCQGERLEMRVDQLPNGVYFIQVAGSTWKTQKVVVAK